MSYSNIVPPSSNDIRGRINSNMPFTTKNYHSILEFERNLRKKTMEILIGKDSSYKGICFIDNTGLISSISSTGVITWNSETIPSGIILVNGEPLILSGLTQIPNFSSIASFTVGLSLSMVDVHDSLDDSPVPNYSYTMTRQRAIFSLIQLPSNTPQTSIEWGSTVDTQGGNILLTQVTNFTTVPVYTDLRYCNSIPRLTTSRGNNLISILDRLTWTADNGEQFTLDSTPILQIPYKVSGVSSSLIQKSETNSENLLNKILLRNQQEINENSKNLEILKINRILGIANITSNFLSGIKGYKGDCETNTTGHVVVDSKNTFTSDVVGKTIMNLTTGKKSTITSFLTHSVTCREQGLFSVGDLYTISVGNIRIELDDARFLDLISNEEWLALLSCVDSKTFVDLLGTESVGYMGNRYSNKVEIQRSRRQYEKEISVEVSDRKPVPKFFLTLSWLEPTLQQDGIHTLNQECIRYHIRINYLGTTLQESEKEEFITQNPISLDLPLIKTKAISLEHKSTPQKSVTIVDGKKAYSSTTENTSLQFQVNWNDVLAIYICGETKYGIWGLWTPIYLNIREMITDKGVSAEVGYFEALNALQQKESIDLSGFTSAVKDSQFEINKVLAGLPTATEIRQILDEESIK